MCEGKLGAILDALFDFSTHGRIVVCGRLCEAYVHPPSHLSPHGRIVVCGGSFSPHGRIVVCGGRSAHMAGLWCAMDVPSCPGGVLESGQDVSDDQMT